MYRMATARQKILLIDATKMANEGVDMLNKIYKDLAAAKQLPAGVNPEGKTCVTMFKRKFTVIDCLKEMKDLKEARVVLD